MMLVSPIDQNAYDTMATAIAYYKIFPYIVADFLTREDAKEMMMPTNLPVNAIVTSTVQVVVPAGTGTGVGPVNTQVQPAYNGSYKKPGTISLENQIKAKKTSGTAGVTAMTETISKAMG
jgi:hypothetical protein